MDSRKTTHEDGDEPAAENVVRLPRDWLGPREELVPIGPRARTIEPPNEVPPEHLPAAAASFWDEDSGSLQEAMQAPPDAAPGRWEAVGGQPTGQTPPPRYRLRHLARPRLPGPVGGRFASPRSRSAAATLAGLLAAAIVVILAVIGQTEGARQNARGKTATSSARATTVAGPGVNRARLKAQTPVVTDIGTEPTTHHAGNARGRGVDGARVRRGRQQPHGIARAIKSATQPVHTTTPTYTPPTTPTTPTFNAPSSGGTSSSTPTARAASSSSQHQPAFGPGGALGPGSSPDS